MQNVVEAARDQIKDDWMGAIRVTAQSYDEFTTEEVIWVGEGMELEYPDEPRLFGPLMVSASKRGWIEATDRFVPSERPERHAAPIRVWRSLLEQ